MIGTEDAAAKTDGDVVRIAYFEALRSPVASPPSGLVRPPSAWAAAAEAVTAPLRTRIGDLEGALAGARLARTDLKQQLDAVRSEAAEMDGYHAETINGILLNAGDEFDGDEAADAIAVRYVRWLEASRSQLITAAAELRNRIGELESQAIAVRHDYAELNDRCADAERQRDEAKRELAEIRELAHNVNDQRAIDDLTAERDLLRRELATAKADVLRNSNKLLLADARIGELEGELTPLLGQRDHAEGERDNLAAALRRLADGTPLTDPDDADRPVHISADREELDRRQAYAAENLAVLDAS